MSKSKDKLTYLSVDKIVPNAWNPQDMTDKEQSRLAQEINEVGFIDPISVIPLEDGTFQILGGEHRWLAAREVGMEEIPCIILTDDRWASTDIRKLVSVRLNQLKGKLNPSRMVSLYEEMADKYGKESLQHLFGFVDKDAFNAVISDVKKGLPKDMPPKLLQEFDAAADSAQTMEDLASAIQNIFAKYGDTLNHSFMVFSYDNREHVYIQMSKKMRAALKLVTKYCSETGENINELMEPLAIDWGKEAGRKLKEIKAAETQKVETALDEDEVPF